MEVERGKKRLICAYTCRKKLFTQAYHMRRVTADASQWLGHWIGFQSSQRFMGHAHTRLGSGRPTRVSLLAAKRVSPLSVCHVPHSTSDVLPPPSTNTCSLPLRLHSIFPKMMRFDCLSNFF